jgi:hypothetical protein
VFCFSVHKVKVLSATKQIIDEKIDFWAKMNATPRMFHFLFLFLQNIKQLPC